MTRLVFYSCLFLQFIFSNRTVAKVSTACYGIQGIGGCVDHNLICTEPLIISITNITFGYRRGCSVVGLAFCPGDTRCCREETGDCFTPYNKTLLSQLQQTCNRRSTCTLNRNNGLNETSAYCFNGVPIKHSYSKIAYQCSINTSVSIIPRSSANDFSSSSTLPNDQGTTISTSIQIQESTPDDKATCVNGEIVESDKGTVVIIGGVLGTALIISILINIILVVYFNRKWKKLQPEPDVHQSEHQYDSTPSRGIYTPAVVYDSLNANEGQRATRTRNEQIQCANHSPHLTPANVEAQTEENLQYYEHQYDSTAGRGSVVVYDSLNTRDQTGYYNMGNINTTGT